MKKTLLLGAVALMASTAMAQVNEGYYLNKDWSSTEVPMTHPLQSAGYDGKIYVQETTYTGGGTGKVTCFEWDENASSVKSSTVDGLVTAGSGFSFDDAGNALVVSNTFANANSLKVVLWNSKNNEIYDEIDLTESLKTLGATLARMDYIGRGAGDMFSNEGASFFFGFNTTTQIVKCHIAKGEFVASKSKVIEGPSANNTQIIVQPLTTDPESDDVAYRNRSNRNFYYHNGSKWVNYTQVGSISQTAGGDVVTLNGVLYTIEPAGSTYRDGWQIVERATNTVVATVPQTLSANTTGNITNLNVQKVSETKAYIYHYHPKAYVAKYTFAVPGDVLTAIEEVEVDANAPVEYYNLQGVKVANPEKGLFIKKQGNKATKVVL